VVGTLFFFLTIPENLSGHLARGSKLEGNDAPVQTSLQSALKYHLHQGDKWDRVGSIPFTRSNLPLLYPHLGSFSPRYPLKF